MMRMLQALSLQTFNRASISSRHLITVLVPAWAGYYLNLDYSAKLFVLTFILVVLGSDHASGMTVCYNTCFASRQAHGRGC